MMTFLSDSCREFIAAKRNMIGSKNYVTTSEIVQEFSDSNPVTQATFKAILKAICYFNRVNGEGQWLLKPEFL